jgi:hypothetical protein
MAARKRQCGRLSGFAKAFFKKTLAASRSRVSERYIEVHALFTAVDGPEQVHSPPGDAHKSLIHVPRRGLPLHLALQAAVNLPARAQRSYREYFASSGEFMGDGERQRAVLVRNLWNLRQVESKDLC